MIEYALLIMLGFCIGGLLAFLLAPTLWHRAVRLTTKRLEATMPMSLSEIEADKDLLRASYAIRIRRLEAGLNKAREKSAVQLVDISKLQMRIAELNKELAELNEQLDERRNAANVFESTIRKRFPELEQQVDVSKAALEERGQEIDDLNRKLARREEALNIAQRASALQQDELQQLREVMENAGADRTGRFKRRPSEWTLEDYRSEYDRLNLELSRMRERLMLAQEREGQQISVLKTELQQLAERIMVSATPSESKPLDVGKFEAIPTPKYEQPGRNVAARGTPAKKPVVNPRPWTGASGNKAKAEDDEASYDARQKSKFAGAKPATASAPKNSRLMKNAGETQGSTITADTQGQNELKSLLDRGARLSGKELLDKAGKSGTGSAETNTATSHKGESPSQLKDEATDKAVGADTSVAEEAKSDTVSKATAEAETKADPKLDQVFREIIEGRSTDGGKSKAATAKQQQGDATDGSSKSSEANAIAAGTDDAAAKEKAKTDTLIDRLRHTQERQTG